MFGLGIRKKVRTFKKLVSQLSYKALFILRSGTIKKYDKLVANREAYFTIELGGAGFTDQLIQFMVFYSFGKALKCEYYFSPLNPQRSNIEENEPDKESEQESDTADSAYDNIFDFLGFEDYLKEISPTNSISDEEFITLDIREEFFSKRGLIDKNSMTSYFKLKLYSSIKNKKKISIKLRLKGNSSFFGTYNILEGCQNVSLDFRSAFIRKQERTPWISSGGQTKNSILVHIRQGDTAVLRTPWNKFINVWLGFGLKKSRIESDSYEKARTYRQIKIHHYYSFLSSLCNYLDKDFLPIRIFSDGYKRAFRDLLRNEDSFEWSQDEIDQLKASSETYDEKAFQDFKDKNQFELIIGEEDQKLYELIYSLLHSDVVVMGTQQRMVPKFLSVYCNPKNMPLVIVLYDKFIPVNYGLGRSELLDKYLLVDINDYDISDIADQIQQRVLNQRNS